MYKLITTLKEYENDIQLTQEYQKPERNPKDIQLQCKEIVEQLLPNEIKKIQETNKEIDYWNIYRSLMNQLDPEICEEICNNNQLLNQINQLLQSLQRPIYQSETIPTVDKQQHEFLFSDKIAVWKGDITTLSIDAIVNAANNKLLGCFQPHHHCIDNCIHTYAGPQVRRDCWKIMQKQQFDEPTGCAKITKAYNLPSKYIIHTVGPIVEDSLEESHINLLEACYVNCLNVADSLQLESIAFCCISTGIFGFPPSVASSVALQTVINWFYHNQYTSIKKVIFNVFSDNDYNHYQKSISFCDEQYNRNDIPLLSIPNIKEYREPNDIEDIDMKRIATFFKQCDSVIIGAAAGFSADAGLDFASTKFFSQMGYPLYSKGIQALYQTMGFDDFDSDNQKWGFFAVFADFMRYRQVCDHQFDSHKLLLQLLTTYQKHYFVKTTNVDGMFERSGYDMNRFFNPQGDFKYIQCATPCSNDVYEFKPYMEKIFSQLDPLTFEIPDDCIPTCPKCGGKMTQNLRSDELFVEEIHMRNQSLYSDFVSSELSHNHKILLIEIGVGFNTPIHIRIPFEHYTKNNSNVLLVRINIDRKLLVSDVPSSQYIPLLISGNQFIQWLHKYLSN